MTSPTPAPGTVTTPPPPGPPPEATERAPAVPADHVAASIDGVDVVVPKGTLIIRAAEQLGIEIPRFCDHPLLDPVAACRACLVEIEGQPKPQPACAVPVGDGMKVRTAQTSPMARTAQRGVLEFLLINHPLDCPVCDKGGECPLQNQAMSHGPGESRFILPKRTFPKPVALSTQVLLDRERCVSCARCTRFADEIAGDPFISLQQRGGRQIVGISDDTPFNSYFSGNTVQICPVGALTSAAYRFRSRPFDLVSVPTTCEHCASGCALRTDVRRSTVMRRLAWDDPDVNAEWNCDKGRFAFPYLQRDRLDAPLVRGAADGAGAHVAVSWPEATRTAAAALAEAGPRTVVLTGGRLTLEDAYAYAKFARVALGTDSIDFRHRATSAEEADLLRTVVAGCGLGVTYADLDVAPTVLLVGFEPEEESPIVFLRLRAAVRRGGTQVVTVAPFASPGAAKLHARVLGAAPGQEPGVLAALAQPGPDGGADRPDLSAAGSVILLGERAAQVPGLISQAVALAGSTGARLAWVPRRAGERGALEAGALPGLLPWGRPLGDPDARAQVATAWGVDPAALPTEPGLDLAGFLAAVAQDEADAAAHAAAPDAGDGAEAQLPARRVAAVVLAGVEAADAPDPEAFLAALGAVPFVLSLETRTTEVTALADVVLPVGVVTEKSGTFLDWEGRARPFGQVLRESTAITDARALALVARAMGRPLGSIEVADLRAELAGLGRWQGPRPAAAPVAAPVPPAPGPGQAVLATWRHLLDQGRLQAGEEALAGTARPAVARTSPATAAALGLVDGGPVTVAGAHGAVTLPLVVTAMVDDVVWVPGNSAGSRVGVDLRAGAGDVVRLTPAVRSDEPGGAP
ncbi:MAG: NADH-quinone oxidoreductase subunit G [Candidatus Nanopelagicales bacterium]|jgi:NADH-quinone oxidoreductase subunit G|nr:NADH-quinone oxidoreductase subunit G [Candidatus Nanopelagicales bacterium]